MKIKVKYEEFIINNISSVEGKCREYRSEQIIVFNYRKKLIQIEQLYTQTTSKNGTALFSCKSGAILQ